MESDIQNQHTLRVARDLYATYCASSGGKNYQGLPCPAWNDLTEAVRGHWFTVARRAMSPGALADYQSGANGAVRSLPPHGDTLAHLADPAGALETWRRYAWAD